jgi:hypothetical protein
MKTSIRCAELPAAFAVANDPVGMMEKKLVSNSLGYALLDGSKLLDQSKPLRQRQGDHKRKYPF